MWKHSLGEKLKSWKLVQQFSEDSKVYNMESGLEIPQQEKFGKY